MPVSTRTIEIVLSVDEIMGILAKEVQQHLQGLDRETPLHDVQFIITNEEDDFGGRSTPALTGARVIFRR